MDKRELLLEAATKLFVERGLHATPTSVISKEAGVSAGILFHYFKTKDDLIDELYVSIKKEYTSSILNDINKIMRFIHDNWKENHILSRDRDFFINV